MTFAESFKSKVFDINDKNFDSCTLELYNYQFEQNPIYRSFAQHIKKTPNNVHSVEDIPFLPISFWKSQIVKTGTWNSEKLFLSSGTTKQLRSQSHVKSLTHYRRSFTTIFSQFFPHLADTEIIAVLPSYQQQGDSSLIYMVDHLLKIAHRSSAYYQVTDTIQIKNTLERTDHPKILFGVSYALLDLIETHNMNCKNTSVIETGGMKGRRKELTKFELHEKLSTGFGVKNITSEYGMSEMTSQCYSTENQLFTTPDWVKILIRDPNDPAHYPLLNQTGGINIIDLANVDTCAFIETMDLGKSKKNGTFEVLGRFDNADIRGCNLLVQ